MTPQISSSKSQLPSSVNRTLKKSLCLLRLPLSTTVRLLHKAVGSFLCCWYQLHMEYMKQLNYSPHPPFITIYTLCTVVSCTLQVWQHLFLNLDCIIFKNFVYWKGILNFVFPMHTHTKYANSARVMLQQSVLMYAVHGAEWGSAESSNLLTYGWRLLLVFQLMEDKWIRSISKYIFHHYIWLRRHEENILFTWCRD